jgi:hypothetical protein
MADSDRTTIEEAIERTDRPLQTQCGLSLPLPRSIADRLPDCASF